ncbi:unnamed protein product, partial [Prunus brigantina]
HTQLIKTPTWGIWQAKHDEVPQVYHPCRRGHLTWLLLRIACGPTFATNRHYSLTEQRKMTKGHRLFKPPYLILEGADHH